MKRVILGTAGHIDHGKTSLIKALTGVDCDRLKEEKQRGITIELGFTSLSLPGGQTVGIIDVPGHERFVKNMVAGAGGMDGVMLIIAADEGVMPQTREHLDICRMLSIKRGLVVLTKTDMVDEELLELAVDDIEGFVKDTFLEGAPVVPVSSTTGEGIDRLKKTIEGLIKDIDERPAGGVLRLPIDRVFTMKGFGTVITGTLAAGKVCVGDEVEILPKGARARIRGIQVHGAPAESATAGMRTALNFQGLEKSEISRGDVVVTPGVTRESARAAVWFEHLETAPRELKNRARVRFHSGTSEILSRAVLLSAEALAPGESGFIQILFERPTVLVPRDRFVLRSYSPVETIGGGEILDTQPPRHKRFSDRTAERLGALKTGDDESRLLLFCREAGPRGMTLPRIQSRLGLVKDRVLALTDRLISRQALTAFAKSPLQVALPEVVREIEDAVVECLRAHHAEHPLKAGMIREELRKGLPRGTDPKLFGFTAEQLAGRGVIKVSREFFSLPAHKPDLQGDQKGIKEDILATYARGGPAPPTRKELVEQLGLQEKEASGILNLLAREGALVKLNEDIFYEARALEALTQKTRAHLEKSGELTIQNFKELTGLTRKFMIPLFEYFDRVKLTFRMGDKRVLRKSGG